MAHNDIKSLRAEWRRQWRATSGKIGVTIYFNRFEVDVLDWLTWQLLHESAKPEAVGRPAALRKLVAKYADDHRDEFAKWRQSVPGPEEQAIFYRRELGQRRRDVPRGKNLSDAEQQRIEQDAKERLREEDRRRVLQTPAMLPEQDTEEENDGGERVRLKLRSPPR